MQPNLFTFFSQGQTHQERDEVQVAQHPASLIARQQTRLVRLNAIQNPSAKQKSRANWLKNLISSEQAH